MQVVAKCPKCDAGLPVDAAEAPAAVTCGACGRTIQLDVSEAVKSDAAVDRCPVCSGHEFYMRKDFNPTELGELRESIGSDKGIGFSCFFMACARACKAAYKHGKSNKFKLTSYGSCQKVNFERCGFQIGIISILWDDKNKEFLRVRLSVAVYQCRLSYFYTS